MEDRHLSLSEVAGAMGVSERTVRRWIKSGKLRAYKPGRDYRIPESAVRTFIEESEIAPKKQRRSSLEPSFNDVIDERRLSRFALTITAAAERWRGSMLDPGMDSGKRFGLLEAALDLSDLISESALEEDWETLTNQERLEIVTAMEALGSAADLGLRHIEESNEARAQEVEAKRRREQIRTWTEAIKESA